MKDSQIQSIPNDSSSLKFSEDDLYKCVHCGLCLNSCPTYLEVGLETESPRGRIAMMKAVHEGRSPITNNIISHWKLCLQCRACEVACPSGVPYGKLMQTARNHIEINYPTHNIISRFLHWVSFEKLLPYQGRLEFFLKLLRIYQRYGAQWLIRKSKVLNLIPGNFRELEAGLPLISKTFFKPRGQRISATTPKRATVSLLSGCIMPLVHEPSMEAIIRILNYNGCDVILPDTQVCCGALNSHAGYIGIAQELARQNIDSFHATEIDAVIVGSAGCSASMKEYPDLLAEDSEYYQKAISFSNKVKDIHEFLVGLPFYPPQTKVIERVTYQDSCHLTHAQRINIAPRTILKSIPGLELIEMPNSDKCCGAAGSYTITQRKFANRLIESKMNDICSTNANIIATANPGCVIQLQNGANNNRDLNLDICFVIDLLDKAYCQNYIG